MGLIKRLFGRANKPELGTPSQLEGRSGDKTLEMDPQAAKRLELVRMLTRDTQRAAGVPDGWLESQVLLEPGRGGRTFIHLRLLLKHWDEQLLRYAVAFQRQLRSDIERLEPGAREWLLSISWQYDVGDQCPYLELPKPAPWATPAGNGAEPERSEDDLMQEDLARLFAVRDAHLATPDREQTSQGGLPSPGAAPAAPSKPAHGKAKP